MPTDTELRLIVATLAHRCASALWLFLLALLPTACGSRGALNEVSANANADAAADAVVMVDAQKPDAGASEDAGPLDASPQVDPMSGCATSPQRRVFHVVIEGPPGPFQAGTYEFTSLNSQWQVVAANGGLEVMAISGYSASVLTSTAAVGTHALGSRDDPPRLALALGSTACDLEQGSFTIRELTVDAGIVRSVTLAFEGYCKRSSVMHAYGCLRYESTP